MPLEGHEGAHVDAERPQLVGAAELGQVDDEAGGHDLKVVRALANHVMVTQDGQVVEEGAAERIFAEPQTDYTRALFAAAFNLETADAGVVRE